MLTRRRDRGSSLMLMPAAVLVFVVVAAICVDFSAVYLGQRELVIAAQGAANDAVAVGYDEGAFYSGDGERLDVADARAAAVASLAANAPDATITRLSVVGGAVEIEVALEVGTIFAKAVPGGPDRVRVTASATADLAS